MPSTSLLWAARGGYFCWRRADPETVGTGSQWQGVSLLAQSRPEPLMPGVFFCGIISARAEPTLVPRIRGAWRSGNSNGITQFRIAECVDVLQHAFWKPVSLVSQHRVN